MFVPNERRMALLPDCSIFGSTISTTTAPAFSLLDSGSTLLDCGSTLLDVGSTELLDTGSTLLDAGTTELLDTSAFLTSAVTTRLSVMLSNGTFHPVNTPFTPTTSFGATAASP